MDVLFKESGNKLICQLCPHFCKLGEGKTGICGVRSSNGKEIELLTYGIISGIAVDPVEKKPLYHFYPGSSILSVGSYGCNMKCDFCQNYHISQNIFIDDSKRTEPDTLIEKAKSTHNNIGIAYTYNEPAIWFEFVRDVALQGRRVDLKNVMVTNGYIAPEPLNRYLDFIDAFNVDLKSFNPDFYKKLTGAELEPVKKALKQISVSESHLEITTLIIPGLNDSTDEMERQAKWISEELGTDVPLHLSRYFPMYKRDNPPTSGEKLNELFHTASSFLKYVYIGNSSEHDAQDTHCPSCKKLVTRRRGYYIEHPGTDDGRCSGCGYKIYDYFTSLSS